MRLFLYGYYGQGNLGDDLLLRACVLGILGICPDASFVVRAGRVATGLDALLVPFEIAEVDEVLADQTRSRMGRLFSALAAYRRHFRGCDWFVFGGGTLFHERQSPLPLILLLLICLMARAMGVRIAALGVGIAELKSRTALATLRGIILLSDVFAVRDEDALVQCRKAGTLRHVAMTGDLAFTLPSIGAARASKEVGSIRPAVGIAVYPPALEGSEKARNTLSALQEAVSLLAASGCAIRLLAFHHAPDRAVGDDETALARVVASLPNVARPPVHWVRVSEDASFDNFAELDLFCGMRFHGHVLAAIHGVPFVGIAADNKIDAICRLFGMPVLAAAGLKADEVVTAIATTLSRKPDRGVVDRCVALAHQNFALLASALAKRCPHAGCRVEASRP
jgi:polysaccharide pyruvyl transferase WcaK-like protein